MSLIVRNNKFFILVLAIAMVVLLGSITHQTRWRSQAAGTPVTVALFLHGIGKGGDSANPTGNGNMSPQRTQRTVTIEVYNQQNQLVATQQGTVTYNSTNGNFMGTIDLGATLPTGVYTVKIKSNQYLRSLVPGIQTITSGQGVTLPPTYLIIGDSNNDNIVNIQDYNILIGCYSDLNPATNCTTNQKAASDLTDDGNVNAFDYNLFLRELTNLQGETGGGTVPTPTQTKTPTPTPIQPVATATPTRTPTPGTGNTPVAINGQLHVCGTKLCNQFTSPIQLRGMSTHGIQWYNQCNTNASFDALANDWKADIVRLSLYVQEDGYETDPAGFRAKVDALVNMAVSRGMYVILDWHMLTPGDPNYNTTRAKEYFAYMAQKHGAKPNIIYEIANEPNGVTWTQIKNYANQVIPVIRQYDPDGIIIVGTPAWSSLGISDGGNAQEIVASPLSGSNLMYTFHFYAASHLTEYRNELSWTADRLPIFVTEWGTQESSGDGVNNFTSSQAYIDLMAQKKISWVNWNYSDDLRSGAVFKQGTCPNGPWTGTTPLKAAGVWVRERIVNPGDNFPTN